MPGLAGPSCILPSYFIANLTLVVMPGLAGPSCILPSYFIANLTLVVMPGLAGPSCILPSYFMPSYYKSNSYGWPTNPIGILP